MDDPHIEAVLRGCQKLTDESPLKNYAIAIIEARGGVHQMAYNTTMVRGVTMLQWQAIVAEIRLEETLKSLIKL